MAGAIRSHRDLLVWQKAMDLIVCVYRTTESFPKAEMYGLTSQFRRAATSISLNIAEGHGRRSTKTYLHFLDIAYGSLMEVDTCVETAVRLTYITRTDADAILERCGEIGRMLNGLMASLAKHLDASPP